MAKQTVNLGTMADNKSGDPLRTAFTKINENFTELYNRPTGGGTGDSLVKEGAGLEELGTLQDTYEDSLIHLSDVFFQHNAKDGFPFGITLPLSYLTYDEFVEISAGLVADEVLTQQEAAIISVNAMSTKQAYLIFQEAIVAAEITSGDATLNFNNLGELVFPDGTKQTTAFNAVKTWTNRDNNVWRIEEAHGGAQFDYNYSTYNTGFTAAATLTDVSYIDINNDTFPAFYENGMFLTAFIINGQTYQFNGNEWLGGGTTYRYNIIGTVSYTEGDSMFGVFVNPQLDPVKWWDAADLPSGSVDFRGAIIDYHAYSPNGGTMIGTIKIADDSNDRTVTHTEVSSGGSDTAQMMFWGRTGNEGQLFFYRTDGDQDQNVKIQWTAKAFYGPEYWD